MIDTMKFRASIDSKQAEVCCVITQLNSEANEPKNEAQSIVDPKVEKTRELNAGARYTMNNKDVPSID